MTDRHAGYIVVLEDDIRDDEAQHVINALTMVKGVVSVEPLVSNWEVHVAEQRIANEWRDKVVKLAFPERDA